METKWNNKNKVSFKKKIVICCLVLLAAGLIACIVLFLTKSNKQTESEYVAQIEVGTNQSLLVGQIVTINGNEMTIDYVEEVADSEKSGYQATGESADYLIPVGTEVLTKLGTTTTFSRLASGDIIDLLVETTESGTEIVAIWIVG